MSILIDIALFLIALVVIYKAYPYCRSFIDGTYFSYFISQKALSRKNDVANEDDQESARHDDIGLSKRKQTLLDTKAIQEFINKNKEKVEAIRVLLAKAGKREESDFSDFIIYQLGVFTVLSSIACFYVLVTYISASIPFWLAASISLPTGVFLGYQIALSNLKSEAKERQERLNDGVPDLIDLMVICTESGLDISRALTRVAREIRNTNLELSTELTLTAIEMEMIPDFKQVFINMETRTDSPQIKSLAKTLSQSIEYGSPLGSLLKELSIEARQKKILIAEERAARIPTYLTLPLMLFILPCLFIVMLGPVVADVIQSFSNT